MCFAKTFIFAENLTGINIEKTFWMSLLSDKIINWYKENKRDLPWRNTKYPYKIWISEIILQQTRVAQGYDYYCRFIERFPDFQTLADADEDEVMKYWQGLGIIPVPETCIRLLVRLPGRAHFLIHMQESGK